MTVAPVPARGVPASMPAGTPRLDVGDLSVTFVGNSALSRVSMEVRPGEIHGLIGQNGSGKSTLAKVLTGLYNPDRGARIAVDGVPLRLPVRPLDSRERGVAVVHQSLGLIDSETVVENMRIGRLRGSRLIRKIDWKAERAAADEVFARLGRSVPLDAPVGALREEERATVAIARALQDARSGEGLIIFDESTRALGRRALEHFFAILDEVVATGTAVLLITHRLEEIIDAADRVTVLRDGCVVEAGREVAGLSEADLAALMLGRELAETARPGAGPAGESGSMVAVAGLAGAGVAELDLTVRRGEVLGLTGVAGSGYDDVPYLVSGALPAAAGTVVPPDREVSLPGITPADAIGAGIALVPEGRENAGLAMGLSVAENAAFPQSCRERNPLRPLRRSREKELVLRWADSLDVRPRDPGMLVKNLSGGNQQKVLLAKWLATEPALFLFHEPTQAVDVGARHTLVEAIRAAASAGCAVIVAGSDENELAILCDRVLVFDEGRVREELTGDLDPDRIAEATYATERRTRLRRRPAQHQDPGPPDESARPLPEYRTGRS